MAIFFCSSTKFFLQISTRGNYQNKRGALDLYPNVLPQALALIPILPRNCTNPSRGIQRQWRVERIGVIEAK